MKAVVKPKHIIVSAVLLNFLIVFLDLFSLIDSMSVCTYQLK